MGQDRVPQCGIRQAGSHRHLNHCHHFPGTRPIDGHLEVIDTEMASLSLSGGGATLTAGAGLGAIPLAASLGNA